MTSSPTVSSLLIHHFSIIKDPRIDRRKLHKLSDILVIALCGVLGNCDGWEDLEFFAEDREDWFRTFLELPNGIPSHDTFERVFQRLDPQQLSQCLINIADDLRRCFSEEIIAIDGKTIRGSSDMARGQPALHVVSAYSVDNGLTLAQLATEARSNEITAIPALLDLLEVKGAIVTIDAMGCQKEIAAKITEKGADYVFALKANHPTLFNSAKDYFDQHSFDELELLPATSTFESIEKGHGRIEERRYAITSDISWIEGIKDWTNVQSIGVVESRRTIGDTTTTERRYFLSSIDPDASLLARAVRGHWAIEASHWTLDVAFREDHIPLKRDHGPENMSILRKMAMNLVKQDKGSKRSLIQRRRQAAGSTKYLQWILGM